MVSGLSFNALVPELLVRDFERSLHFYVEVVGFRVEYAREESRFAFLSFEKSQLMIEQDAGESPWRVEPIEYPRGRGLNLSITCSDVRALAGRVESAGVPLRLGLEDRFYRCGAVTLGERHFLVQDPDGYLLRFAQELGEREV
jgi:catechol 2,3-dioxygenase-like lactoylglutathione lyase family enzyme